jgi:hypothetical protein
MVELLCSDDPATGHFTRILSKGTTTLMNLVLSPFTGKFEVQTRCTIRDDYEGEQTTGQGQAELSPAEIVSLYEQLQSKLGKLIQHWSGPNGRRATLTLLQDGTWSVWSSESCPNYGPLRNESDYYRQIRSWRQVGMRPEVTDGR